MNVNYNDLIKTDVLNLDKYSINEDLNQSFYQITTTNDDYSNIIKRAQDILMEDGGGVLNRELIVANLTNVGKNADGTRLVYLNLKIPGYNLKDINALKEYNELQMLDVSFNKLDDVSVLSSLSHLVYLNVSNNSITKLFDFLPPYYLKHANFSFNNIQEIGNLMNFHYLQYLDLNHNKIDRINGLEYCQRLKYLNIGYNNIKKIEGLHNLNLLEYLDLRSNHIKRIEGLNELKLLRCLNLSNNMIRQLDGLYMEENKLEFLQELNLEDNKIVDINEIDHLLRLDLLRDLNLINNPIRELNEYRLSVLFRLSKLCVLDKRRIDQLEKVNATQLMHPSNEYIASRDHMTNLVFSFIQDHTLKESTLPNNDSPYPVLILCSPIASDRIQIARRLCQDYPDYFDFVQINTTKQHSADKNDDESHLDYDYDCYKYISIDEFEQNVTHGKYICCNEYLGNWYGITYDSIEDISKKGLACVIQCELECLLSFKQTYFEPRCILLISNDTQIQYTRVTAAAAATAVGGAHLDVDANYIQIVLDRTNYYAQFNVQNPGFFDSVILTNDLHEGYESLRNLILTYLGISNGTNNNNNNNVDTATSERTLTRGAILMDTLRPKVSDEIKRLDLDLQRSDSFLPSNTVTANRSQQSSHHSIDTLSQIYSNNLRQKYGNSAPAVFAHGQLASNSLLKRSAHLKNYIQLDSNNPNLNLSIVSNKQLVSTNSKMVQHNNQSALSLRSSTSSSTSTSSFINKNNLNKTRKSSSSSVTPSITNDNNNNNKNAKNKIKLSPLNIQSPPTINSSNDIYTK